MKEVKSSKVANAVRDATLMSTQGKPPGKGDQTYSQILTGGENAYYSWRCWKW